MLPSRRWPPEVMEHLSKRGSKVIWSPCSRVSLRRNPCPGHSTRFDNPSMLVSGIGQDEYVPPRRVEWLLTDADQLPLALKLLSISELCAFGLNFADMCLASGRIEDRGVCRFQGG